MRRDSPLGTEYTTAQGSKESAAPASEHSEKRINACCKPFYHLVSEEPWTRRPSLTQGRRMSTRESFAPLLLLLCNAVE